MPRKAVVQSMADAHGCSLQCVYAALAYRSDSELAKVLRKQAIDIYGGVETTKIVF